MKLRTIDLTLAAMFVALMAVGANITALAPFMVVGSTHYVANIFCYFSRSGPGQ